MPLFVYFLFVMIYGGANGYASLFDPTSFIGLIHILFLVTILGALLFLCREPTEEEKKRHWEIQERGKHLKETYQRTGNYEDYQAWKSWCDQYNGGRRN